MSETDLKKNSHSYPILPVRDTVVFPHMVLPLLVGRDRSLRAIQSAVEQGQPLFILAQKQAEIQDPAPDDLYTIGTLAQVARVLHMPEGTTSVLIQGKGRAEIQRFTATQPYLKAKATPLIEPSTRTPLTEALVRAVHALFEKCAELSPNLSEEALVAASAAQEAGLLADIIASSLHFSIAQRQEILETLDINRRLQRLSVFLAQELDVLELENKIQAQVQEEVEKGQREYILREQMKAIQTELGELDSQEQEINELRQKVASAQMPNEVREKAEKELERLGEMPPAAPETAVIRTYLDWLIDLPWAEETEENSEIAQASKILEEHHYGLPKAKERILEHLAVRILAKEKMRTPILCFVGPPGTGKTSLGQSIAHALGRNFVRVSLGGIRDEAEIRGHRRTYVGALPGRIIQTMARAKTKNPVFMLDEIDKLGIDFRGDPAAALLEVLDPEQNHAFSDHYLDVPYDLSHVLFITTANILDPVPPALRDRLEVIEFPGYLEEEKIEIARRFLVPRQREENGIKDLRFSQGVLIGLIREYTYEAGVRNLEREIANICRKVARSMAEGKKTPQSITPSSLAKYLGPAQYTFGLAEEKDEVGVATGVAVTAAGGDTISIEVSLMQGKGNLILTGQLGEVMQESAQAALSYARAHAPELGINKKDFDRLDIHIHIPEGATPKDGPSAGITIATALVSALMRRPVKREVAMSGEITLRGRVLPIGGLREKVLAAHRAGLKTMLLPKKNQKDLIEIPAKVKREMRFVFVERMDQVLPIALAQAAKNRRPRKSYPGRAISLPPS